jgi:hypothetical protein
MADGLKKRGLFGDNMSVMLPSQVVDVSELREIPDNQEVFVHESTDQSVVVEILEMVDEPDDEAVKTHFRELASSNDAQDDAWQIASVEPIPPNQVNMPQCQAAYYISGQQLIAKFKESAKNAVNIHMGLFRLPGKRTDILITLNDPVMISPQSSSGKVVEGVCEPWTVEQFKTALQTLTIQDDSFLG